jgi:hypothetical protein
LVVPFLVGANVTVTVVAEAGSTVNALLSIENGGLCFGPLIVTCSGPVPVLPTTTLPSTDVLGAVLRVSDFGETVM